MPILDDIRDHKVLGREYKKGELAILRPLIVERFGEIPAWAEERLSRQSAAGIEALGPRLLIARSIEDLLPQTSVHPRPPTSS